LDLPRIIRGATRETGENIMANFGALTDHFGLAATLGTLIDAPKTPRPQTRKDALDKNGDIADTAYHGNTAGELFDATCVYQLDGANSGPTELDLEDVEIGQIATGKVATSAAVDTANTDWPKITITGVLGTPALEQDKAWALTAGTIYARKQAQLIGIVVTTGELTSCGTSASCDLAQADDGEGEPVAFGVSGAIQTATAEAVATSSAAPVLAAAEGWTVQQATGKNEPQADWHTATINVEKKLTVTITPPA
jgi:hypothetical protein